MGEAILGPLNGTDSICCPRPPRPWLRGGLPIQRPSIAIFALSDTELADTVSGSTVY